MAESLLEVAPPPVTSSPVHRRWSWLLLPVLLLAGGATIAGMRHTSTAFDETLLAASGARGYATGKFDLILDHPPLFQYVYGAPVYLSRPHYPTETLRWEYKYRFRYARMLFFESGNDPIGLAFRMRLVAVAIAMGLVALLYLYARRFGRGVALLAATLLAFMPDMLAHGGIAYNDVPMALVFLLGAWALDEMVRQPTWQRSILAGAACALALSVKFSAIALAPVGLLLFALEALVRGRDWRWWRALLACIPLSALVVYLGMVAAYRGDFSLAEFRFGLEFNIRHAEIGHVGVPAFLLGSSSIHGFWYFFPVALFFKTPVSSQLLGLVAIAGFVLARRSRSGRWHERARARAASSLRMPVVAALVFSAFLLSSGLNIGVRHSIPVLPLLCLLVAIGARHFWQRTGKAGQGVVAGLALTSVVLALSWYPRFLTYVNEFVPRDRGYRVFVDSSLDWGQGLPDLRDYMRAHGLRSVYLGYFGTAEPEAYGIEYEPMVSFLLLPPLKHPVPKPEWLALSATILEGGYVGPNEYAPLQHVQPAAVVGHTFLLYPLPPRNVGPAR